MKLRDTKVPLELKSISALPYDGEKKYPRALNSCFFLRERGQGSVLAVTVKHITNSDESIPSYSEKKLCKNKYSPNSEIATYIQE